MEWISAAALLTAASALAAILVWVSWSYQKYAGLWWCAGGIAIALDGSVTLS